MVDILKRHLRALVLQQPQRVYHIPEAVLPFVDAVLSAPESAANRFSGMVMSGCLQLSTIHI